MLWVLSLAPIAMKILLSSTAALLFLFLLCKESILPKPTKDNCIGVSAWIDEVEAGEGQGDIVIKVKGDKAHYYINRGLEKGLKIENLQKDFLGKEVHLKYIDNWSILDPRNQYRHVASMEVNGNTIYSEIQP